MNEEELFEKLDDMGAEVDDTLDRLMGDSEMYIEYLCKLKDNENIVNLRKAVDARDEKTAMSEVHTLKGVALNLGLLPLVDVCMDMLMDFREGNTEDGFSQIEDVEKSFKDWETAISCYKK